MGFFSPNISQDSWHCASRWRPDRTSGTCIHPSNCTTYSPTCMHVTRKTTSKIFCNYTHIMTDQCITKFNTSISWDNRMSRVLPIKLQDSKKKKKYKKCSYKNQKQHFSQVKSIKYIALQQACCQTSCKTHTHTHNTRTQTHFPLQFLF